VPMFMPLHGGTELAGPMSRASKFDVPHNQRSRRRYSDGCLDRHVARVRSQAGRCAPSRTEDDAVKGAFTYLVISSCPGDVAAIVSRTRVRVVVVPPRVAARTASSELAAIGATQR
jgi:hypothetical protein